MKTITTVCGYCGCGCNIVYRTANGSILSAAPKEGHPVNQGKLCAKGWTGHAFVRHEDRLQSPLIRGEDGVLREASWDEAIDLVYRRFSALAEEHGPESLGVFSSARCTNEENYLLTRFARAALGTPNIDHCARL